MVAPRRRCASSSIPTSRAEGAELALIAVLAILAGFAEAGLLVLVAQIATSLAAGHSATSVSLGPIHNGRVSVGAMLAAAGVPVRGQGDIAGVRRLVVHSLGNRRLADDAPAIDPSLPRCRLAPSRPASVTGRPQELVTDYATYSSGAV